MQDSTTRDARLVLDLALTIRHDGHGGVADDLADTAGLTAWVLAHPEAIPETVPEAVPDAAFVADQAALAAVRELRAAVRALFARAVRPGEPSPADAARLMPVPEAVERLNAAAARTPTEAEPEAASIRPPCRVVVPLKTSRPMPPAAT